MKELLFWICVSIFLLIVIFVQTTSYIRCHDNGGIYINEFYQHVCIKVEIIK